MATVGEYKAEIKLTPLPATVSYRVEVDAYYFGSVEDSVNTLKAFNHVYDWNLAATGVSEDHTLRITDNTVETDPVELLYWSGAANPTLYPITTPAKVKLTQYDAVNGGQGVGSILDTEVLYLPNPGSGQSHNFEITSSSARFSSPITKAGSGIEIQKDGNFAKLVATGGGSGTVTEVTVGTGLDVTSGTTTPNITLDLDEIGPGGTLVAGDHLVAVNGTATQKQLISAIPLGIFSNNLGWTSNAGTVTQVDGTGTVSGLTLTGSVTSSGSLTLGGTLSVLEGDIVDGSILARVASDETITGAYTFTDVDGIFVNAGAGGLYLQNSSWDAASLMTAGLKYVPGGGVNNAPYDRLNWEYTDTAGGSNNAGSAVIMKGNGTETGLTVEWYTAPTSTGIGANPASLTKRFDMTTAALEYGTAAQFRVTSAGLITAGEWDATTIAVAHGGTGISGGIAADQFLIGDGTGNPYVASGAGLTWTGSTLNATAFAGDGAGLDNVVATDVAVAEVAQNAPTATMPDASYQILLGDTLAAGDITVLGGGNQMYYATSTDTLTSPNFAGDGSSLTGLTASQIAAGVFPAGTFTMGGTLKLSQAATVMTRMTNTNNTDLSWDQRVSASGVYELRAVTDAGTTIPGGLPLQLVHATGQMRLRDGTRFLPTFSFAADTNIGMYRLGSNHAGMVSDSFSFVTVGATTNLDLNLYQTSTLRARIRYDNAGQSLLFALGTGTATRLKLDPIDATSGRSSFLNGQVHATEYQTQYEDTGTVVLDWDKANQLLIDFDSTSTTTTIDINETVMQAGGSYVVLLQYNSGSAQTVAWTGTGLLWANGDVPTSATGATAGDITVCQFFKTTTATYKIIGSYFVVT